MNEFPGYPFEVFSHEEQKYTYPEKLGEYGLRQKELSESSQKGELILDDNFTNASIHKISLIQENGIAVQVTAYNITEPVIINGKEIIFARLEPNSDSMESEEQSKVVILKKSEGGWELDEDAPEYNLQDPFYCGIIEGEHIFGGVEVYRETQDDQSEILGYRTVFYSFEHDIKESKKLINGPERMKDIRIKENKLENGETVIDVLTRPQGEVGGKGRIGHIRLPNMQEVYKYFKQLDEKIEITEDNKTIKKIKNADLIEDTLLKELCGGEEWVGGNEMHTLLDGTIGVLCHLANSYPDPARRINPHAPDTLLEIKNYYAAAFVFDPETHEIKMPLKIISTAEDFPHVTPKKDDLGSITFPGGLVRIGNGQAEIYCGIGDAKAGKRPIEDPFWQYEQRIKVNNSLLKAA